MVTFEGFHRPKSLFRVINKMRGYFLNLQRITSIHLSRMHRYAISANRFRWMLRLFFATVSLIQSFVCTNILLSMKVITQCFQALCQNNIRFFSWFLKGLVKWYARRGIAVKYAQTNNDFANIRCDLSTLFECTATKFDFLYKLLRLYTLRHNDKADCSHWGG